MNLFLRGRFGFCSQFSPLCLCLDRFRTDSAGDDITILLVLNGAAAQYAQTPFNGSFNLVVNTKIPNTYWGPACVAADQGSIVGSPTQCSYLAWTSGGSTQYAMTVRCSA